MSNSSALRVAVVGCGPKGLYALERLVAHLSDAGARLSVDVYEPHPAPGAGPVYDPAQPHYLRMNFAADMVDMWPARDHDPERPSFAEWRSGIDGESDEAYPSRALVGRYLADGFRKVASDAPPAVSIRHLPDAAALVTKSEGRWKIRGTEDRWYEEVLIATGHAGYAVFPVAQHLSRAKVPPGAVVAIRGFALTMIDASLALTEGRGGEFRRGREPYLLGYEGGAEEVAAICPWSRTGRPMLAKPDPASGIKSKSLDETGAAGRAALAALPPGSPLESAADIVAEVAERSLHGIGEASGEADRIGLLIEDALAGRAAPSGLAPAAEIERSIAVGVGEGEPGADWALGHAWRVVYPTLVERLGGSGLDKEEWPAFRRLAAEMERISFGPPPVNAAKLLALIECGKVSLSHLTTGPALEADVVVDAVIPPPGALNVDNMLLEALLRDGHVRIPPGRRGLELTPDVTCVGKDGRPSEGLGAIGRPTEDWVIGNDTLNRGLHPHPDLWARRVVKRATGE